MVLVQSQSKPTWSGPPAAAGGRVGLREFWCIMVSHTTLIFNAAASFSILMSEWLSTANGNLTATKSEQFLISTSLSVLFTNYFPLLSQLFFPTPLPMWRQSHTLIVDSENNLTPGYVIHILDCFLWADTVTPSSIGCSGVLQGQLLLMNRCTVRPGKSTALFLFL